MATELVAKCWWCVAFAGQVPIPAVARVIPSDVPWLVAGGAECLVEARFVALNSVSPVHPVLVSNAV
jgi:hypothetical protein